MKGTVTFNTSGSGSKSGRITIPKVYLDLMKLNETEKEINFEYQNGKLIIEKSNIKRIENVSYDDMMKFILNNVEYTYNVSKCLAEHIIEMGEIGIAEKEFYMTKDQEHFMIAIHTNIKNKDTEEEDVIYNYDVEKVK